MTSGPTTYTIRVEGHLDGHWAAWLDGAAMTHDDDGTVLTLAVTDQAQLHGILRRLHDIGAVLTALRATACLPNSADPHAALSSESGPPAIATSGPTRNPCPAEWTLPPRS